MGEATVDGSVTDDGLYRFEVPRSVYAPGVDEVVLQYPKDTKDVVLLKAYDLAFTRMLVSPKVDMQGANLSLYNFIVGLATSVVGVPRDAALDAWADRAVDDEGNLTFEYAGHTLSFVYPSAGTIHRVQAEVRTLDVYRTHKRYLKEVLPTLPSDAKHTQHLSLIHI